MFVFFFFKQKTAYEMRISDWSSDVCSSDLDASDNSRHSIAEYVQLEGNLTDRLSTSLAVRHEDYSDFGTNLSYALSGRYGFDNGFALRGTVSTGFRAPGLGQQHRSEEHTSELQSLMRISYAVFCLKKKTLKIKPR